MLLRGYGERRSVHVVEGVTHAMVDIHRVLLFDTGVFGEHIDRDNRRLLFFNHVQKNSLFNMAALRL